jgi:tRNA(fMet)-specific endonuclease VapC
MILLDSDNVSTLLNPRSAIRVRLLERLDYVFEELAVPIVVAEEQLRGWLAEIHRVRDLHAQVKSYIRLGKTIEFLGDWVIAQWSESAAEVFQQMRRAHVRIGTQDLKIASIALAHGATLLSSNLVDFEQVPGLQVEDWLHL